MFTVPTTRHKLTNYKLKNATCVILLSKATYITKQNNALERGEPF